MLILDIALIKNNAKIGAQIASCYYKKENSTVNIASSNNGQGRPLIIGGSVLDITSKYTATPVPATSNLGKVQYSCGGVGRNVAEACIKTGADPFFLSFIGNDFAGESILNDMKLLNLVYNINLKIGYFRNSNSTQLFNSRLQCNIKHRWTINNCCCRYGHFRQVEL